MHRPLAGQRQRDRPDPAAGRAAAASAQPRATRAIAASTPDLRLDGHAGSARGLSRPQRAVRDRVDDPALHLPVRRQRRAFAERSIALIGDSHAAHWRGAVEVVAQARGWTRLLADAQRLPAVDRDPGSREDAARQLRDLAPAPSTRGSAATPRCARSSCRSSPASASARRAGAAVASMRSSGFMRAWRRLPGSVKAVIVLRDTPVARDETTVCVRRAIRQDRRAGAMCSFSRSRAVRAIPPRSPRCGAHAERAPRRPDAVHVQPQALLPGRRRRARPQGPDAPDAAVRQHAGTVVLSSVNRMYGAKPSRSTAKR